MKIGPVPVHCFWRERERGGGGGGGTWNEREVREHQLSVGEIEDEERGGDRERVKKGKETERIFREREGLGGRVGVGWASGTYAIEYLRMMEVL